MDVVRILEHDLLCSMTDFIDTSLKLEEILDMQSIHLSFLRKILGLMKDDLEGIIEWESEEMKTC